MKEDEHGWLHDFGITHEEIFNNEQPRRIIRHMREQYGDEPEFLWEKFPDNAVFRRKDNAKWYAILLTVRSDKLGLGGEERMEVLDIRADAETQARLLDYNRYFPGYHMNKQHWLTIRLDGVVPLDEITPLIARSYELAAKKK